MGLVVNAKRQRREAVHGRFRQKAAVLHRVGIAAALAAGADKPLQMHSHSLRRLKMVRTESTVCTLPVARGTHAEVWR